MNVGVWNRNSDLEVGKRQGKEENVIKLLIVLSMVILLFPLTPQSTRKDSANLHWYHVQSEDI